MVADRGPQTESLTIVFIVLATVFVAARFYTRIFLVRSIKQDDWWVLAAWVAAVAFSISICVAVHFGLGRHKDDIPVEAFPALRKAQYTFSVLYNPCLMLTKNSIIIFYLSVMSKDVDPVFKWCNWICLAVVNVAGLALTLMNLFQCHQPISAAYIYPTPPTAKCTDIVTLYLSSAPVNIITDIAILFLPMPILTGLRLPKKQKIILLVTFSAGAFVAVVDVVRIAYLQDASLSRLTLVNTGGGNTRIQEQNDFSWYSSYSFMWSAIEVNIGIICACVPSLKALFLRFLPRFIKDEGVITPSSSIDVDDKRDGSPSTDNSTYLTNPAAFRKPTVMEYAGEDDGDNMGFLNMLAGPDDEAPRSPTLGRSSRLSRVHSNKSAASDFGFVTMGGSKNMLKMSNRQCLWPIAVVTVIFFLWGFAYGLLDTLNAQFQVVAKLSQRQTLGLHAAYYGGYLVGPLTLGHFVLSRYGFKACMIAGLCVYGCGTLVFWPSAVLTSYPAFIISNFIVAFGLSCLEVAANPYIALCGPLEYAEVRLNLSQAFQAVGTVCSPLLANRVLFKNVLNAPSLVDVQWTYLGIGLFDFVLAVIFYYIPLPEATDEQLEEQADNRSAVYRARVGPWRVVWVTLALGVFAQWCCVGGQEGIGNYLQPLMAVLHPSRELDPFDFQTLGHSMFAVGRFLSTLLNYLVKPRWILLGSFLGVVVLGSVQMNADGTAGAAVGMLTFVFEASIFSVVYAVCMRGMGDRTKLASACMTAAISGGAVIPVIQWAVVNARGVKYSYCVVVATYAFGSIFPIYLNLVPAARKQVDPVHENRSRRRTQRPVRTNSGGFDPAPTTRQFGLAGILARRKRHRSDVPTVQHLEQANPFEKSNKTTKGKPWGKLKTPAPAHHREQDDHIAVLSPHHTNEKSGDVHVLKRPSPNASPKASPNASPTGDGQANGGGGEDAADDSVATQRQRAWTEMDDVRNDYHKVLRGL